VRELFVFASWLDDRRITQLCDVSSADLDAYHRHVSALACPASRQGRLLLSVRPLWSYRVHLPAEAQLACEPFDGTCGSRLAGSCFSPINKTPRIAEAPMESLLAWSLTMVEHIGADITAARRDYHHLLAGTHPSQAAFVHLGPTDRVRAFVDQARRDHTLLPGHPGDGAPAVNWAHLARLVHLRQSTLRQPNLRRILNESELDVDRDSFIGSVTARIGARGASSRSAWPSCRRCCACCQRPASWSSATCRGCGPAKC
jgi:hypothetical protein